MFLPNVFGRALSVLVACVISISAGGCSSSPTVKQSTGEAPVETTTKPAVRYGRYRLVEVGAEEAQRELMEQLIDFSVPDAAAATVADALEQALLRTGYTLCESSGGAASAFARMPLPAPHSHLGPIRLRDALRLLVGPSWVLEVNAGERRVCFSPVTAEGDATPHESASTCVGTTDPLMDIESGPPFTPLQIERVGSEFRLSVASLCRGSAGIARILRVGDIEGGWLLARLNANEADFVVAGVPQGIILR